MGTDIHIEVEKQDAHGVWHYWPTASWYDHHTGRNKKLPRINSDRNYDWFAILADVRNGRGFAGAYTGEGFNSIAPERGIPPDASAEVLTILKGYDSDDEANLFYGHWLGDHSYTWILLSEILEFDHSQTTFLSGVASEEEFKKFCEHGCPNEYSGGVFGGKVTTLEPDQMKELIAGNLRRDPETTYYTRVNWQVTYGECVTAQLDNLRSVFKEEPDHSKIRLIIGFDS